MPNEDLNQELFNELLKGKECKLLTVKKILQNDNIDLINSKNKDNKTFLEVAQSSDCSKLIITNITRAYSIQEEVQKKKELYEEYKNKSLEDIQLDAKILFLKKKEIKADWDGLYFQIKKIYKNKNNIKSICSVTQHFQSTSEKLGYKELLVLRFYTKFQINDLINTTQSQFNVINDIYKQVDEIIVKAPLPQKKIKDESMGSLDLRCLKTTSLSNDVSVKADSPKSPIKSSRSLDSKGWKNRIFGKKREQSPSPSP